MVGLASHTTQECSLHQGAELDANGVRAAILSPFEERVRVDESSHRQHRSMLAALWRGAWGEVCQLASTLYTSQPACNINNIINSLVLAQEGGKGCSSCGRTFSKVFFHRSSLQRLWDQMAPSSWPHHLEDAQVKLREKLVSSFHPNKGYSWNCWNKLYITHS